MALRKARGGGIDTSAPPAPGSQDRRREERHGQVENLAGPATLIRRPAPRLRRITQTLIVRSAVARSGGTMWTLAEPMSKNSPTSSSFPARTCSSTLR